MALVYDRVKETTTSTGSGNIVLAGAVSQYVSFSSTFGIATRFYYAIVASSGSEWEVGLGYLTTTTNLVREAVYASSNNNALVTFSSGTKDVFNTVPAYHISNIGQTTGAYTFNANPVFVNVIGEGVSGSPAPIVYGSMLSGTIPTIDIGSMLSGTTPTASYGNGSASSLNYDFTFASIAGNGSGSSLNLDQTFTATYGSMLSGTTPTVDIGSMLSNTTPTATYGNGMSGAINLVKFDGGGANG